MIKPVSFALTGILFAFQFFCVNSCVSAQDSRPTPAKTFDGQSEYEEAMQKLKNGGTTDMKYVFDLLTRAADKKHPDATGALGYLYANGVHVVKNDTKARVYFQEAANLGSKDSRLNMALFLVHGRGGPIDLQKGISLLQEMTLEGHSQASLTLGELYYTGHHCGENKPDYTKAYQVLITQAEAGNPTAQNFIGVILRDGRIGPQDMDSAQIWFEKAAWQGNAKACTNLAELWNYQSQERKCRIEALRWLIVADHLGDIVSKYHLADITPLLAKDEEATARKLADITLQILKNRK